MNNKCITFDLILQKCWMTALCSNATKSCYDWIVLAVVALCMQRQGIPATTVACMFTTLRHMEHYTRTLYGNSTLASGAVTCKQYPFMKLDKVTEPAPPSGLVSAFWFCAYFEKWVLDASSVWQFLVVRFASWATPLLTIRIKSRLLPAQMSVLPLSTERCRKW